MGRGIAYQYDHFLLFEDSSFNYENVVMDENEEIIRASENQSLFDELVENDAEIIYGEFDDYLFNDFKETVASCFKADLMSKVEHDGRESHFFAENHRLKIGIDSSGGCPCVYLSPKGYNVNSSWDEKEYVINQDAKRGFTKLIKAFGKGFFSVPTSAWTRTDAIGY